MGRKTQHFTPVKILMTQPLRGIMRQHSGDSSDLDTREIPLERESASEICSEKVESGRDPSIQPASPVIKVVDEPQPEDEREVGEPNTKSETPKAGKNRRKKWLILGAIIASSLLLPVCNEEVDSQITLVLEYLRPRFMDSDKSQRFWRLIAAAKSAALHKPTKAYALLNAATQEARSLGDRESLLVYSLLMTADWDIALHYHWQLDDTPNPILKQRIDHAVASAKEALEIALRLHGERHSDVSRAYEILAKAEDYYRRDRRRKSAQHAKAQWAAECCVGPYGGTTSAMNPRIPWPRHNYALDLIDAYVAADGKMLEQKAIKFEEVSDYSNAEKYYLEAVKACESKFGEHPCTAVALNAYACFLRGRGRIGEAKVHETRVDKIWKRELTNPTWKLHWP